MTHKQLVKKTIKSFRLRFRPEKGKGVLTYYHGTKQRFLNRVRACPSGEYQVLVRYVDKRKNETPWSSRQETIRAINAFTERKFLEEFLT